MKKKMNIILFSICFLASLMAETYFVQAEEKDLFSITGIAVVVLITGYLLMDSIRTKFEQSSKNAKFYLDQIYKEETEKAKERYNEMTNLQKATYAATKKNTAMLSEQFDEVLVRIENLETNNTKALQKMVELQKKSLEGQKNALNLEINYNKENTKQLINTLKEESDRLDQNELLTKILSALELNNTLLKEQSGKAVVFNNQYASETEFNKVTEYEESKVQKKSDSYSEDFYEALDTADRINDDIAEEENASEQDWSYQEEETETSALDLDLSGIGVFDEDYGDTEVVYKTKPSAEVNTQEQQSTEDILADLLNTQEFTTGAFKLEETNNDDPNKALSADDIAALIASMSSGPSVVEEQNEIEDSTEEINAEEANLYTQEEANPIITPLYDDPNKALSADDIAALFASMSSGPSVVEEQNEVEDSTEEINTEEANPVVTPLYDDPNKALSADDIAALFASMSSGPSVVEEQNEVEDSIEEINAEEASLYTQEEAKPVVTPLYDDPNKALSADDIAALFATMSSGPSVVEEQKAEELSEEIIYEDSVQDIQEAEQPVVTPLYEDPNKALTADEIAKLFASFGQ